MSALAQQQDRHGVGMHGLNDIWSGRRTAHVDPRLALSWFPVRPPCHPRPGEEEWLSSGRPNQRLDIAVSIAVREGGVSEVAGPQPQYERRKPTPHANQPP